MSTVEYNFEINGVSVSSSRRAASVPPPPQRPLQRIGEVRQQQGTSLRSVARKMNLPMQEVRDQEESNSDLRISDLLKWQEILEVPLADLLIDNQGSTLR